MCTCKDEQNKPCSCSKNWLWLIPVLVVLGGLTWWYLKSKRQTG